MYAETHAAQQSLMAELEEKRRQIETYAEREIDRKAEIIQQQKAAIKALTTPILSVWDRVLALPIVGQFDTARAQQMTEALLERIATGSAKCLIVDVTGVEVMDTATAANFARMIDAARLLGSHCVVTGVGPEVATTSVELGLDFGSVPTLRTLKDGLRHCLRHLCADAQRGPAAPESDPSRPPPETGSG
jgi:rsbT co-antagonist protein RsbR